jgi:hypothetical protein
VVIVRFARQKWPLASDAITHTHEMMSVGQLPLSDHSGRSAHIAADVDPRRGTQSKHATATQRPWMT